MESVVEGYDQEPPPVVGLAAIEFAPVSAPELYQVKLRDGISEFTIGFPRNQIAVTGYVNWGDLATPHSMSVVAVDWDGGHKVCGP